jgi:hypothetical protein
MKIFPVAAELFCACRKKYRHTRRSLIIALRIYANGLKIYIKYPYFQNGFFAAHQSMFANLVSLEMQCCRYKCSAVGQVAVLPPCSQREHTVFCVPLNTLRFVFC